MKKGTCVLCGRAGELDRLDCCAECAALPDKVARFELVTTLADYLAQNRDGDDTLMRAAADFSRTVGREVVRGLIRRARAIAAKRRSAEARRRELDRRAAAR